MAQLTIQQTFDLALQHHQAGRLRQAKELYRQILARQPEHPDAMYNLGVIALQVGRNDIATDLMRRVIAFRPNDAEVHKNLGLALHGQGQLDGAIAAYRQAIALRPSFAEAQSNLGNVLKDKGRFDEAIAACLSAIALNSNLPEAHNNLGIALKEKGQFDEAVAAYRRAIALNPNLSEAHVNLGIALEEMGQIDQAIAAYRQAIAVRPNFADAHSHLGKALKDKGQFDEALVACRRAIALDSNLPDAHNNLGVVLHGKGQLDDAIAEYRQAIALSPRHAEAHGNLGVALKDQGQLDEAIAASRQAIALNANLPELHNNFGVALYDRGQFDEAVAAYRQAIGLRPNYAVAHFNLAFPLLARGDFQRGWQEYEWRWKCQDFPSPQRNFAQPPWDGCPLQRRTLLLYTEQGFGDAIQFVRYLPLVEERGGKVVVECQPELQRLFQAGPGNCQIVARGQPLPAFDFHCPLLSLPRVFGASLANIPNQAPYLHADAQDVRRWRDRLADHPRLVKVGLVWAGSLTHKNDRNRSMKLARLTPLGQAAGVLFFSLQKGAAAAEAKALPPSMELVDLTQELKDFADTAALIANLDLVISVDTAIAHLAGAMGKPVWTLLPFVPDWRWLLEREDSAWYPTMRLFRQPSRGDWDSVIANVAHALPSLAKK